MELTTLYECIYNVYKTYNVKIFPVNCFSIVEKSGYKIKEFSELTEKKQKAFIKLSTDACFIENTLFYIEHSIPGRIRFSIAHELGHVFLNTDSEDDADEFASHFLAPRIFIHKYRCDTADQIHDLFGLSYKASNKALVNYRKWYDNIVHTTRRPSEPERQLELLLEDKTYQNEDYYEDDDNEEYEPTLEEIYVDIQRALKAGLPIPPAYTAKYRMFRKMGLK